MADMVLLAGDATNRFALRLDVGFSPTP